MRPAWGEGCAHRTRTLAHAHVDVRDLLLAAREGPQLSEIARRSRWLTFPECVPQACALMSFFLL